MSRNILMKVVFSIVVLWVATHFTRQAKAQATNGIISGTVTDASGAAVPGVTIQVKNVNTGVTRTVLTNEQGRYRVPDLLVGAYEVQGALPGFQTVVQRGIPLTVGSERVVDFSLQVGQPETTVTVEGEIAQVDTTSTAIDRKSTRLNSSHGYISYAVFCLKKKKKKKSKTIHRLRHHTETRLHIV